MENVDFIRFEELNWLLSRNISMIWKKNVEQRLPGTQSYILIRLKREGPLKVSSLAEALGITPGAVTMLSDKLLAGGYISRTRDEEDRRVVYLKITEKGIQTLLELKEENKKIVQLIFNGLAAEDVHHLIRIYEQVLGNIEKYAKEL